MYKQNLKCKLALFTTLQDKHIWPNQEFCRIKRTENQSVPFTTLVTCTLNSTFVRIMRTHPYKTISSLFLEFLTEINWNETHNLAIK